MKHLLLTMVLLVFGGLASPLVAQTVEIVLDGTVEATCPNTANASIFITPTGGTAPFSFAWSNGSTTEDLTNVAPGSYSVTVTDANGDKDTLSDIDVLWANLLPAVEVSGGILTCGSPEIELSSIYSSFNTSILWAGPNGFSSTDSLPIVSVEGDYLLKVTDLATGCSATGTATVSEDKQLPGASATGGSVDCVAGSATITASSPTPGATFAWTANGGIFSNDAQTTVTQPGDYAVIVTNPANGCTSTASATVVDLSAPPIASAGGNAVLNCLSAFIVLDGSGSDETNTTTIWTTADGHFDGFENTLFPSVDAAGTYVLTILDTISQCSATDTVVVTENAPVEAIISAVQNVSCHGGANGYLEATATGGTGSYFFGWSNGSNIGSAEELVAGIWRVTVVDDDGCTATATATIPEPAELFANTEASNISALLATDGKAWATPTGGTTPYMYAWQTTETTDTAFNLPAGPVSVLVTDALGCTAIGIGNVQNPGCALSAIVSQKDIHCFGAENGEASILVENATAPVSILWSNAAVTDSVFNLEAADYFVAITDGAGCSVSYPVAITQPEQPLTAGFIFQQNVGCPEFSEGSLTASVFGGTQFYTYEWSNGGLNETISGISTGNYIVTVTDENGCTARAVTEITSADQTAPVIALKDITVQLGADGTVTLVAADFDDGSFDAECDIAAWAVSPTVFGCGQLGEQTVTITVTDGSGNSATALAFATVEDHIAPTVTCPANIKVAECHALITYDAPTVADNCPGGSLAQMLGLPSGATFPVGLTVNSFKFTDLSGNEGACSFIVSVVGNAVVSAASFDVKCFGQCDGTTTVTVENGFAPHTFYWSNGATLASLGALCSNNYAVTVTDADGCTQTATASVGSPNLLTVNVLASQNPDCPNALNGSINLSTAGGTAPFTINWSNAGTGLSQTNLAVGTYSATVTDANGCVATTSATLTGTDLIAPVLALKNATISLDDLGQAVLAAAGFDNGSTDNCGIASWTFSPATFDCGGLGMQEVTVTATDFGGNSTSEIAFVNIIDTKTPVLACNSELNIGACQAAQVFYAQPIVFDNCPVNTAFIQLVSGLTSGAAFPTGTTVQLFSYTDASGNEGTCSFKVNVKEAATVTVANVVGVTCPGDCDGSIVLNISGNSGPFTLAAPTTNLCAGDYSNTVSDVFGCTTAVNLLIAQPTLVNFSISSVTDETDGGANGSIFLSVTGGVQPYTFFWTFNGQPFNGNGPAIGGLKAGDYHLLVTDANGCSYNSQIITINNIVGTSEPVWASGLRLQPNPADGDVRLVFSDEMGEKMTVRFFDAAGRLGMTVQISGNELVEISGLAAGVWQVQIVRGDGSRAVRKLVVAHR